MAEQAEQSQESKMSGDAPQEEVFPPGMTKKIVQEGEGDERPKDGSEVTVHYVGTLEDGKEFDSSVSRNEPFNFTLGNCSVIQGWELGVRTMRRGEVAEFSLPPELAYGESGSPPTIPPNARLNFKITLLDWEETDESQKPIYKMTMEERLSKCQEKKDAGGVHFKDGKYDLAIKQYRDVMKLAEIGEFIDDGRVVELDSCQNKSQIESEQEKAQRAELKQMLLVGYLNLALCYLKVDKLKESIENCNEALKIDSTNVKAHFRKGLAYLPTKDYEEALKQFDKVLELDPNNSEAKVKKAFCNNELRNYYQKQKEIYKNFFK